jgi:protein SCO1/2
LTITRGVLSASVRLKENAESEPGGGAAAGRARSARLLALAGALIFALAGGCRRGGHWHATDVTGTYPPLELTMTRASTGQPVTAADFRGDVVMLYFGYTSCRTVCPLTLGNMARLFKRLGPAVDRVRMLFVTVDPHRDTPAVLATYVRGFGPEVVGLRGDPDQLTALARRYRVAFSAPPTDSGPYIVIHSSAIYVFDGTGRSRLLISSMSKPNPDLDGLAADLRRLVKESRSS